MNRLFSFISIAALGTLSATASADMYKSGGGSLYAGGNYTFVDVEGDGFDADLGTLSAKVGGYVTPILGLEARAGFGVADEDLGFGNDLSVNSFFGGYATINAVNESPVTPYGILGFTRYELEVDGPLGSAKEDDSDLSYGVGVNIALSEELSGNLEYMRYADKDDVTVDGIGLGLTVHF
ncbi:porin family protein [Marinobacter confluentis]|uniref:Porin family protein n=1 Tax=Marinobacter confluentis TaxID=1697557 RepID=A0A4Z1BRM1_9GAMM|nr:porin family protein [Marinobacter confluentis]TGN40285.1 porin family protein [Marinobacter confluentis]